MVFRNIMPITICALMASNSLVSTGYGAAYHAKKEVVLSHAILADFSDEYVAQQMQGSVYIQNEIANLRKENEELRNSLSRVAAENKKTNEATCEVVNAQTPEQYAREILALKRQNERLEKQLEQVPSVVQGNEGQQAQIASLQKENEALKQQLAQKTSVPASTYGSDDIAALQQQNQSLRETIRAQNEQLIGSTNAGAVAERAMSENMLLKQKLEHAERVSQENASTAQKLYDQNQQLIEAVKKRNAYIEKLEALKRALEAMQARGGYETPSSMSSGYMEEDNGLPSLEIGNKAAKSDADVRQVLETNKSLEEALQKERDALITYRKKIRDYQQEIEALKSANNPPAESLLNQGM